MQISAPFVLTLETRKRWKKRRKNEQKYTPRYVKMNERPFFSFFSSAGEARFAQRNLIALVVSPRCAYACIIRASKNGGKQLCSQYPGRTMACTVLFIPHVRRSLQR